MPAMHKKDDLAEAWFDRADRAALQVREGSGFLALPVAARLEHVILAWLGALQAHRRLTREMLGYKLEPGHLHLQIPGLMRISRTVQWFRETAQQDSRGLQRIFEETALTLVYVSTFARWLYDESPDARATCDYLARALRRLAGGRVGECPDKPTDAPRPDICGTNG